jgi:hypothetical protein
MLNLDLWHIVLTTIVLLFLGGVIGGRLAILRSIMKAGQVASQGVTALLEDAADQIALSSAEDWTTEGLHLLKSLDVRITNEREFVAALKHIRGDIDVRIETGHWPDRSN